MFNNRNVGGVCGFMGLKIERPFDESGYDTEIDYDRDADCLTKCFSYFVDIQRAQQMEYNFAHLLDKPFEAVFGFIHVLPGAFSAYNMEVFHESE